MHAHILDQTPTPTLNHLHLPQEVNHIECQEQNLIIITKHTQKTRRRSSSSTDMIALFSIHIPDVLFLVKTPVAKDCAALCDILSDRGYHIRYHQANKPLNHDEMPPKARIPDSIAQRCGGCMIAYRKDQP